jgi:hypothetical protein
MEGEEPAEPKPDLAALLVANMQVMQEISANLAQPKKSQIVIQKNPDGSYTGERIDV